MSSPKALPTGSMVLVTGGQSTTIQTAHGSFLITHAAQVNGFVASHVADQLLEHGYGVRGTARDEVKLNLALDALRKRHPDSTVEGVVVPDMVADHAFDEAMSGVSGVAHVASDVSTRMKLSNRPLKDFLTSAPSHRREGKKTRNTLHLLTLHISHYRSASLLIPQS